jgi:cytidylate kinase
VGKRVAERLGYLYVDEEIVARAAAQGGLERGDIADEERRKSFVSRFLETMAEGGDAWMSGASVAAVAQMEGVRPADIRALIRETIEQTAAGGKVVIVAHAASHALEPGQRTLRVFVTASQTTRQQRVGAAEGLDPAQAARMLKDSDAGRRDYLKRFHSVDRESPTDYDLVINTDLLTTDQAADLDIHAADREGARVEAAQVSLLRWLRRQLRQPIPMREHLEAAVENDDVTEARRLLAGFEFSAEQRRNVEQLLDAWERQSASRAS